MIGLPRTAVLLLLIALCQYAIAEEYSVAEHEGSNCIYLDDVEDDDGGLQYERVVERFELFKKKFKISYSDNNEHTKRLEVFKTNLQRIKVLQERELGTAKYGITKFADLTEDEFRQMVSCTASDVANVTRTGNGLQQAVSPNVTERIPKDFDWRDHGAVTPVKNQGDCGACWAFSVVGNIEGLWAIHSGKKAVSLSAQELVDCVYDAGACTAGHTYDAYNTIIELGGLEKGRDYPYVGKQMRCAFDRRRVAVSISGWHRISTDERKMAQFLYAVGPMTAGLNATVLQLYCNGVLHPTKRQCDPHKINHGVLIVGYGVEASRRGGIPYWIIKNSWGTGVGEEGYFKIYRGDGTCGLNRFPTTAVLCKSRR